MFVVQLTLRDQDGYEDTHIFGVYSSLRAAIAGADALQSKINKIVPDDADLLAMVFVRQLIDKKVTLAVKILTDWVESNT